jgi:hypothetical protein
VIAVVVAGLAIAGGIVAWRNHQLSVRQAQSVRYAAALSLLREGKDAEAAKLFSSVAGEGGGYGNLAVFEAADLAAKSGDRKTAIADYDKLAASSEIDPELRDVATLLSVMNGFADSDPRAMIDRLKPLDRKRQSVARHRARVDRGGEAQIRRQGRRARHLQTARRRSSRSGGVRARAAEMAAVLAP